MITDDIKSFVAGIRIAIVATAAMNGYPHLALGNDFRFVDERHIVFESWFCQTTLQNLEGNPQVALAVMRFETGTGFQFIGTVVHGFDTAILDGYVPGTEPAGQPQALTRLVVRVEKILAFCSGVHTDLPLGPGGEQGTQVTGGKL